jgi:glycosyltransferase involved in cell wall biosynthesis
MAENADAVRVVHIISGLELGGAEMMLYQLLGGSDRERFQSEVVSMTEGGSVGERIGQLGIPVHALGMRRRLPTPWHLLPLIRVLRRARPDVIQTWMYHADLFGGVAARLAGRIPVVWGIHHTQLERESSEATRRVHIQMGYAPDKMQVIPNGIDLDRFRPDPEARTSVRAELGLEPEAFLIGMVARFHPQKDHHTFVRAASLLADQPGVHFLLCGKGITGQNAELSGWIGGAGMGSRIHLLGLREDIPRVVAALDISTLSSRSEAFPLVVGEAMASGVPCVVTDVGDLAEIVGTAGVVVPPRDPEALAEAWNTVIGAGPEGRARLGELARKRIAERYSLQAAVMRYQDLYTSLCPGGEQG